MKQIYRDFLLLGDSITTPLRKRSPLVNTQSHTVIMLVRENIFPSILDEEKTGRRAKKNKLKCAQAWNI